MVEIVLIIRSVLVPLLVAGLVSFLSVGWIYVYRMKPLLGIAEDVMKKSMSALGTKSGQVRLEKSVEKAVAGDLMKSQAPELEFILQLLSPDTRELIEDNPEAALKIAQRLGLFNLGGAQKQTEYDLG